MSWSQSRIFRTWVNSVMLKQGTQPTGGTGSLTADTIKAALYNNTATPNVDDTQANCAYNAGQWVTANEVTGASEWVAGGRALTSTAIATSAGGVNTLTAANLTGTAGITVANVFGCLLYDNTITGGTVAKQGVCYAYFGGATGVTGGTYSVAWSPNGVLAFTV